MKETTNDSHTTGYIVMEMCLECHGEQTQKEPVTESGVGMGKSFPGWPGRDGHSRQVEWCGTCKDP